MSGFSSTCVWVKIFRFGELPELTKDLTYKARDGKVFVVPKGFRTDFASIPRVFWNIIAPIGKHTLPSVLHDYLYTYGTTLGISRKEADKYFWDAMDDSSVARITANVMWAMVRLFARKHFNKKVIIDDSGAFSRRRIEEKLNTERENKEW